VFDLMRANWTERGREIWLDEALAFARAALG
jgi:hypothetical protein